MVKALGFTVPSLQCYRLASLHATLHSDLLECKDYHLIKRFTLKLHP